MTAVLIVNGLLAIASLAALSCWPPLIRAALKWRRERDDPPPMLLDVSLVFRASHVIVSAGLLALALIRVGFVLVEGGLVRGFWTAGTTSAFLLLALGQAGFVWAASIDIGQYRRFAAMIAGGACWAAAVMLLR